MTTNSKREWYVLVEGQVYLSRAFGQVVGEMMQHVDREFGAVLNTSPHTLVHLIHDTRYIEKFPSLSELKKLTYPAHPRCGYVLTVGGSQHPVMRVVIGMARAIARTRSRDMATLDDAYAYLLAKDPSLPPLNTWKLPPPSATSL